MVSKEKKVQVKEIKNKIADSQIVIFAQYSGLDVNADYQLRKSLRGAKSEYHVFKNRLAKLALDQEIEGLNKEEVLVGPTSFIFGNDPIIPSKIATKFAKENEALQIKGGIYQNKYVTKDQIKELAALPSREELLSKLVYLLNSPISGLVNVLQGNLRKLVYALNAVKDKKNI